MIFKFPAFTLIMCFCNLKLGDTSGAYKRKNFCDLAIIFSNLEFKKMSQEKQPKYSFINYETRLKIIHHIFNEGLTIKKTAEILGLKPSTTRMILKRYREDGVVFERKCERHERMGKGNVPVLPVPTDEKVKIETNHVITLPPEEHTFMPYIIMPFGCWPPQNGVFM